MFTRFTLYRITDGRGNILIRRGGNASEALAKARRKDTWIFGRGQTLHVMPSCELTDKERYSKNHRWAWMDE